MDKYKFNKTKYGEELLIDMIRLEDLEKYLKDKKAHVLSYYDITFISEGSGYFHLDEYKLRIERNKVIFSSPGQFRKWEFKKMPKGLVLIFEEDFLCTFFNDIEFVQKLSYFNNISTKTVLSISEADYGFLKSILLNIEEEILVKTEKDKHILRAMLYQVLVWLNRKYKQTYSITDEKINLYIAKFKKLIHSHFIEEHGVSYYADKLNITDGHLNDLVKKHLRVSTKQYLQNRLILEAKRMLLYTDFSVAEIAHKLNFEDPSYFVRKFRQQTNKTPLSFRKRNNP